MVRSGGAVLSAFVGLQSELAIKPLYRESIDFRDAISIYRDLGFELSAIVPNNAGHFPLLMECDCIMINSALNAVMAALGG